MFNNVFLRRSARIFTQVNHSHSLVWGLGSWSPLSLWMPLQESLWSDLLLSLLDSDELKWKLLSYGDNSNLANPNQGDSVKLNPPDKPAYDATMPWVYKVQTDMKIASNALLHQWWSQYGIWQGCLPSDRSLLLFLYHLAGNARCFS